MNAATLTPEQAAFVELGEHSDACPTCCVDHSKPDETRECPEAAALYRAWMTLWKGVSLR